VPASLPTAREFLDAAYAQLEFDQGALFPAERQPKKGADDWVEKGDWQALAAQVGAEKLFFVRENPVIVFASLENRGEQTLRRLYQRIWCMARPPLLFLARPGELAIYDLAKPPPKGGENADDCDRLIKRVTDLAEVQTALAKFHRERIETGAVFGDERFGDNLDRADRALIRDLKVVRRELSNIPAAKPGPWPEKLAHLHALLGRCIFARYLEDRQIINRDYFEKVVDRHQRKSWQNLLDRPLAATPIEPSMSGILFLRVLRNKDFAYAVFEQLAHDFNGDTFPVEPAECERIHQGHLDQLLGFLCGDPSAQQQLFFYAYRFDVIPIELISSIYEEFYNERTGSDQNQASHYTPPALVEFVLAHTLTPSVLATKPRVFDAACGSGIFLVEAFRRIVRHLWAKQGGKAPSRTELRTVLRDQLAGMDLNPEAIRVAAFSLYLAFLHYQHPRDINEQRRLPYLKWVDAAERGRRAARKPDAEFFDILLHCNAFDLIRGKFDDEVTKRFGAGTATVVVGNPPWGYPKADDEAGSVALTSTLQWCDPKQGRPIGDKELSQAFIHLTLALLKDGGRAGLLVSSGVFFKHHATSKAFRRAWLTTARLEHVVNFAHVRHVFFTGPHRDAKGVAPFVSVVFQKTTNQALDKHRFPYWSAKRTVEVENTQYVLLNPGDLHYLNQTECVLNEKLWKVYWWGGHRDQALITVLARAPSLDSLLKAASIGSYVSGQGFAEGNRAEAAAWLSDFRELPVKELRSYGPLRKEALVDPPSHVERRRQRELYEGPRLLVRRGVPTGGRPTIRFEKQPYCYRHSVLGFRIDSLPDWQQKLVTGIYWSSLARYYLFCTAGTWGMWHDELLVETIEEMPIRLASDEKSARAVVARVEELLTLDVSPADIELAGLGAQRRLPQLERELDEAVFDLYDLDKAERDLIRDMCSYGLDLFYRHHSSDAVREVERPSRPWGTLADVANAKDGLAAYLSTLVGQWNHELKPKGEFAWRVLSPSSGAPVLAILLETRSQAEAAAPFDTSDRHAWENVLQKLAANATTPIATSGVLLDTFFRHVTEDHILIIKRNERRFWTRSAAREDAEATLLQSIINTEQARA
jgi:Eco57I restriction-modification methylase